jgi:hypothetical protein
MSSETLKTDIVKHLKNDKNNLDNVIKIGIIYS